MKKFTLFFIFFYFIFNIEGNAKSTRLKGINEVDLLVESLSEYAEECSITEKQIETTVKYVLSNSKIKISEKAFTPILYIKSVVTYYENICSVYSKITVQTFSGKDPYKLGNRGSFLYYHNDRMASGKGMSLGNVVIEQIEEMMKELVVKHHEDNL
jgi:hypothetical protein